MNKTLATIRAKHPGGIVVTGWWKGEPIWRPKTAEEKMAEALKV